MMQAVCEAIPTPQSFAPGIIGFLDCQAQNIGLNGYAALAAPGSTASILLTGLLTIFVAIIGYRLMLGYVPDVQDGVLMFVKIGLVLMLATSWPAFQTLIYDVTLRAPAELVADVGGSAGLPGARGGLVARLDMTDRAMQRLAILGVGAPPPNDAPPSTYAAIAPPPTAGFNDFALGYARIGFLVSSVTAFAIVRLLAGILLAVTPLFVGFLLFDGTRGLFEGWAKALIGTTFAAFAAALVLAVELAFLEPWLAELLTRRRSYADILGAPAELLAATLIFGLTLTAVLIVSLRLAATLRMPRWAKIVAERRASISHADRTSSSSLFQSQTDREIRSRAAAIAGAVMVSERRETEQVRRLAQVGSMTRTERTLRDTGAEQLARVEERQLRRRTGTRASSLAAARDRRS